MAGNHVLLETIELTTSAASVTFDNIPQSGYTDLKLVASARSSQTDFPSSDLLVKYNNTTSNQSQRNLRAYSSGPFSQNGTDMSWGNIPSSANTANTFSSGEWYIPNYTASAYKSASYESVVESNTTGTYDWWLNMGAELWSDTAAITSITLNPSGGYSFVSGSTFSLYGVAATGTTPVTAPKATGGNMVSTDGTYWYHTFLSSGTFTPQTELTCDYLVVAGGGGAGGNRAGGGGAGGLLTGTYSANTTSYLGAKGANGIGQISDSSIPPTKGSDSSLFGVTVYGGGTSIYGNQSATNGGSGAGGTEAVTTGGTGVSGQGNAGGSGAGTGSGGSGAGGGGGGQSTAGNAGSGSTVAGSGGQGWTITSTFSPSGAFSGMTVLSSGGGGGAPFNSVGGTGGTGAGNGGYGTSSSSTGNGGNATSYGSGGGGGAYGGGYSGGKGGNGYQGIVVIRYAMA